MICKLRLCGFYAEKNEVWNKWRKWIKFYITITSFAVMVNEGPLSFF